MRRGDLSDLAVVAETRSFTRAAARLGLSAPALSHALRGLEARLGVRLLARTTRGVAPTEAGERLLLSLGPALEGTDAGLAAIEGLRATPAGTLPLTTFKHAASSVLLPVLPAFAAACREVQVEVEVEDALLEPWAARQAGYRLYHPSRRQAPAALAVLIDLLRRRLAEAGRPPIAERGSQPHAPPAS